MLSDLLYLTGPFVYGELQALGIIVFLAPFIANIFKDCYRKRDKNKDWKKKTVMCCLSTFAHDWANETIEDEEARSYTGVAGTSLVFALLEDSIQLILQLVNNFMLGGTLTSMQIFAPAIGFIVGVYTIHDYWNCVKEKEEREQEGKNKCKRCAYITLMSWLSSSAFIVAIFFVTYVLYWANRSIS